MTRSRGGFTLMEMVIVLVVLTLTAGIALPAFVDFGATRTARPADAVLELLRAARRLAVEQDAVVSIVLDPESGHYRADTSGRGGWGILADTVLVLADRATLESDSARVRFLFRPSGAAIADSVRVRAGGETVVVLVDPWSGEAHAEPR